VNPGKQEGVGKRKRKIGEFSFRGISQPTMAAACRKEKDPYEQALVLSISSAPTVGGAITSVSLVGGGREELRGTW